MPISLQSLTAPPPREPLSGLLHAYYDAMRAINPGLNDVAPDNETLIDKTWAEMADVLPPHGQSVLAWHGDDLVGCGVLRRIRPDAGELKRLFVRPDMQGHGLGRRLVEARIDGARALGLTDLYVDTVKGNRTMLALYDRLGFRFIDRYPENANPPALAHLLVYLHRKVDPG